jgi:tryptophan halogenase
MSMREGRIEKVVIVGGGTAGWMAAAALSKVLGSLLRVELVESEEIGIIGVGEATIPQIQLFNRVLELDEDEFLRATNGAIKLGIEFVDWVRPGHRYLHAFGLFGLGLGHIPFHQLWLKSIAGGETSSYWDYSLNSIAAAEGRFERLQRDPNGVHEGLTWAFHFDASLYAKYLRGHAEKRGVVRTEGKVAKVNLREPDGFVRSVTLEDGREIAGDLFIDCSGFCGLLIEQTLKTGYEDWTPWLPCDRAVAVPCASNGHYEPFTRSTARPAGWQWRIPLQHRIGNGCVYSSRFMDDDEAASILLANLDGEALAEPRQLRFTTGRRRKSWSRNCVALGLASGFMEPLESTSIHMIQSGLDRLIAYFPTSGFSDADIDQYNRLIAMEAERVRDFLVFHYRSTERVDTPFWRHCQELPMSEELVRKIALFRSHGRVHHEPEDLFTDLSWIQVLLAQSVAPEAYHPMADLIAADQLKSYMADLRKIARDAVAALPRHTEFLARHCGAAIDASGDRARRA